MFTSIAAYISYTAICQFIYNIYNAVYALYAHYILYTILYTIHTYRMHKKSAGLVDAFRLYLASRTLPAIYAILTV